MNEKTLSQRGGEKEMAKLIVTIQPNGKVQMHVEKVTGDKCLKITKQIEDSLGKVTDKKLTSDFYQQPPQGIIQRQIIENIEK